MNAKQTVKKYIQLTSILFLFVSIYIFTPSSVIAGTIFSAPSYIGLSEGLIGYWSFNDNDMAQSPSNTFAMDRSGNGNNGKLKNMATSSARVTGKIGQGLSFDGTDDYVDVGNKSDFNFGTSNFSIAGWVKTSSPNTENFISKRTVCDNESFWETQIQGPSPSERGVELSVDQDNLGTNYNNIISSPINDGNWHHFAFTRVGATLTVYIDGKFDTGTPFGNPKIGAGTANISNAGTVLLAKGTCASQFSGSTDDVRVYNRALSVAEIQRLYRIGATAKFGISNNSGSLTQGLVGYWSFNDNDMAQSPNNMFALDRSGSGNNGKLKNMATSSARVTGKIGQGLSFDGTNDFVSVTHHSSIDLTSALTVALWVKTTVADKWLVEKRDSGQANGWAINGNSDGTFGFGINNGGTTQSITSTSLINDGNWHFLVGVLDAGVVKLYFDMQSQGTPTGAPTTAASHTGNLFIGKRVNDTDYHNGLIDDARVYNRALSVAEIQRLYRIGATAKFGISNNSGSLTQGLVGYWSFNDNDMAQSPNNMFALDRSGQGNNGRLNNTATSSVRVSGKIGQGLSFDGSNDYVNIGNSTTYYFNGTLPFAISLWFKHNGNARAMISRYNAGVVGNWEFFLTNSGGVKLRALREITPYTITGNTVLNSNTWYHGVFLYDGVNMQLFLNGERDATPVASGNISADQSNLSVVIGSEPNNGVPGQIFDGLIDDVRVYNRALTADEIKRLYNLGR